MSENRELWTSSSKTIINTIPRVFLDENISLNSLTVNLLTAKNIKYALNLIIQNESEVLNHSEENELFFSPYTALITHFLCNEINTLSKTDLPEIEAACKVLLKFFLSRITEKNENCTLSKKQLAMLIKSLCKGSSSITKMEVSMLVTNLIFAQSPDGQKEDVDDSKNEVKEASGSKWVPWSTEVVGQLDVEFEYEKMMSIFEDTGMKLQVLAVNPKPKNKKTSTNAAKGFDNDAYAYVPLSKQSKKKESSMAKLMSDETRKSGMETWASGVQMQEVLATKCLRILQRELHGNDVLLNVCSNLPTLKKFEIAAFTNSDTSEVTPIKFSWPTSYNEATHTISRLQQVLADVSLVNRLFSLPILEPLTNTRLKTIINIAISCLHAAISATIASGIVWSGNKAVGKEEDLENYAVSIVQKAMDIFNVVSVSIEKSSKAVYFNYHLMVAWSIFKGLQSVLFLQSTLPCNTAQRTCKGGDAAAKGKVAKEVKKENKKNKDGLVEEKLQINFNLLFVTLIMQSLKSLNIILIDLEVESLTSVYDADKEEIKEEIKLFAEYSALQRTRKLTKSIYFSNLFHYLLSHLFKKGVSLGKYNYLEKFKLGNEKDASKNETEGKNVKAKDDEDGDNNLEAKEKEVRGFDAESNSSDSNTFYEEEFSSSQDDLSFDDDDSESNLNHWFEEAPVADAVDEKKSESNAEVDAGKGCRMSRRHSNVDTSSPNTEKTEGYIKACIDILGTLMRHFINSPCSELVEHLSTTLTQDHMAQLAYIIRELDHEQEQHTRYSKSFSDSELLFESFSKSLSCYVHALINKSLLNDQLQLVFLDSLNVGISAPSANTSDWPFKILPRTLAILVQVVMHRQKVEKKHSPEEYDADVISGPTAIRNIWFKFIQALHDTIKFQCSGSVSESIIDELDVGDVNQEQIHALLFLFHQLELVQRKAIWQHLCSVFVKLSDISNDKINYLNPNVLTKFYQLIEYFLKNLYQYPLYLTEQISNNIFGVFVGTTKVTKSFYENQFYDLCANVEYNNQEVPKVDGLACAFIISGTDDFSYDMLYSSVLSLMNAGSSISHSPENKSVFEILSRRLLFHLNMSNRLLSILPPSVEFLKKLDEGFSTNGQLLLHTFKWIARINVEPFQAWTLDFLVKQRLTFQQATELMTHVIKSYGHASFELNVCMQYLEDKQLLDDLTPLKHYDIFKVCIIDMMLFRIHALLDPPSQKSNIFLIKPTTETTSISKANYCKLFVLMNTLLKRMVEITNDYLFALAWKNTKPNQEKNENAGKERDSRSPAIWHLRQMVSVNSSKNCHINSFSNKSIFTVKQPFLETVLDKWNNSLTPSLPQIISWKTSSVSDDLIPVESYLDLLQKGHLQSIKLKQDSDDDQDNLYSMLPPLKHMLMLIVKVINQLLAENYEYDQMDQLFNTYVELSCHATMEFFKDSLLEKVEKRIDDKTFIAIKSLTHATEVCHKVISMEASSEEDHLRCQEATKFLDALTQKPLGLQALNKFYAGNNYMLELFGSVVKHPASHGIQVFKYLDNILTRAEDKQVDDNYTSLYESFEKLLENEEVCSGMKAFLVPPLDAVEVEKSFEERRSCFLLFLTHLAENQKISRSFISNLFKHISTFSSQLLPPSRDVNGFSQLLPVLNIMSCSDEDKFTLFSLSLKWIKQCQDFLTQKNVLEKVQACSSEQQQGVVGTICELLARVKQVVSHTRQGGRTRCYSGLVEVESKNYFSSLFESEAVEDNTADDDSNGEDSDEDSLNNKLCTFTYTKKEYMSQHWYHCHTCKMVEGVGVCTVCAKVCHYGHDLSYAKHGSFFCDCGEKGVNGNCKALSKRNTQPSEQSLDNPSSKPPHHKQLKQSNLAKFLNKTLSGKNEAAKASSTTSEVVKQSTQLRVVSTAQNKQYIQEIKVTQSVESMVGMLEKMVPTAEEFYHHNSPYGQLLKMKKALNQLQTLPKSVENSQTFFSPIISSQEGTLDSVKITYQGDQGQVLRQLLTSHIIRRVSMCLLASPSSKRQHLAVSNDKGKVTLLQLSSLLKMAHSGKKKLVVSRLCMLSIPFNILTLSNCPANEDLVAVCGFKDCHVLTFNASGCLIGHLALQLALETGNHIIKAVWLPGSQSELAIVTAEFVKIFDLATDAISPQYFLLLASGKIRDVTFVCGSALHNEQEDTADQSSPHDRFILITCSLGYLSVVKLDETTNARSGMFYITKKISTNHPDIKEASGVVMGGGASVYFSHSLQLLFFSFRQGKNFMGYLARCLTTVHNLTLIPFKPTSKSSSNSQPAHNTLVQWSEVHSHPGLVSSVCQATNNPVILMLKPDSIHLQEIEVAKLKVQDFVLTRHAFHQSEDTIDSSIDHKVTSMVVLCADGSLRILNADASSTDTWINMSPSLKLQAPSPTTPLTSKSPRKKNKSDAQSKGQSVTQAVDFFEHCRLFPLNDIEFGGTELLRYYNVNQLRSRLNTYGLYIASISSTGFELEVSNLNSATSVIVGIRVSVGSQSVDRAPTTISVFNRVIPINVSYSRWYDIPFTREESLGADKSITIKFGASRDPGHVVMVDSVKVYYKSKASFSWPDELYKEPVSATSSSGAADSSANSLQVSNLLQTPFDRLLTQSLELLDEFLVFTDPSLLMPLRKPLIHLTTSFLSLPTPHSLHQQAKFLMSSLFSSKDSYYWLKDRIQLGLLMDCLVKEETWLVSVAQQHLYTTCAIAHHRPENLVNFVSTYDPQSSTSYLEEEEQSEKKETKKVKNSKKVHDFLEKLNRLFWSLVSSSNKNLLTSSLDASDTIDEEATVSAMVKIMQAFLLPFSVASCTDKVPASKTTASTTKKTTVAKTTKTTLIKTTSATRVPKAVSKGGKAALMFTKAFEEIDRALLDQIIKFYFQMLFSKNVKISHTCKNVLLRSMRPRVRRPANPPDSDNVSVKPPTSASNSAVVSQETDDVEGMSEEGTTNTGANLDTLMNPSHYETMVQLAIALSLQDQNQESDLQGLHASSQQMQEASGGNLSDTTVSDNNDDDEDDEREDGGVEGGALIVDPVESPMTYSPMQKNHLSADVSDDTSDSNPGSISVSGRSSATDLGHLNTLKESKNEGKKQEIYKKDAPAGMKEDKEDEEDVGDVDDVHLEALRIKLLERFINYIPELASNKDSGSVLSFLQTLVGLTISTNIWRHEAVLEKLLQELLSLMKLYPVKPELAKTFLNLSTDEVANTTLMDQSDEWVLQLLAISALMLLMSYKTMVWMFRPLTCDTDGEAPTEELLQKAKERHERYADSIREFTCNYLKDKNVVEYCLYHLHALLHSKHPLTDPPSDSHPIDVMETGPQLGQVLKLRQTNSPPDLRPFFFNPPSNDLHNCLHFFLFETLIRVPLNMCCYGSRPTFSDQWMPLLAELMARHQSSYMKRKVRKVMLSMCESKENYRLSRDLYYLSNRINSIKMICQDKGLALTCLESVDMQSLCINATLNLPYDLLISVVEHLKVCIEVATQRTHNWQQFCYRTPHVIPFLMVASISLDSAISPMLLQLLQNIIKQDQSTKSLTEHKGKASKTTKKDSKKSLKGADASDTKVVQPMEDACLSRSLVECIFATVSSALLKRFIVGFLLECNQTSTRWLAHNLLYSIFQNSSTEHKQQLIDIVWEIWPDLHMYGSRSAQFVDLLGYFTIKLTNNVEGKLKTYVERAIDLMRTENNLLSNHPNANVYNALEGLVHFGGYYLEREPCLVCNNPEEPFSNFKLSNVKVDSKFTTSSQIVKLVCSHTISKFNLKIADLKKSKMVKSMIVYYNNKPVQAILELKNKPALWHRAKKVTLSQGQTEVKVEFALPIVACNLMIEFSDFYDNLQATSETLQCPRCSASVPAVPGVCSNCGENVFQCHKCRAINYDEKDPFLCNTCGYCKYAKFDFTMTAKQCCTVEPIENEEDRKKLVSMINNLLESADVMYKQVQCLKALFDELLVKISDPQSISYRAEATSSTSNQNTAVSVNKSLQQLALKYCNDCRQAFEGLSAIIQKVLAYRKELVEYDNQQQKLANSSSSMSTSASCASMALPNVVEESKTVVLKEKRSQHQCYGCAIATVEQCITLLRAMSTNPMLKDFLAGQGLIKELFNYNLRRGSAIIRSEARHLLCLMSTNHPQSNADLLALLQTNVETAMQNHYLLPDFSASVRHEMLLLSNLLKIDDSLWEDRLRCVMKLFKTSTMYNSPSVQECVSLPCMGILQQLTRPPPTSLPKTPTNKLYKKNRPPETTNLPQLVPPVQLTVNFKGWMESDKDASFETWAKRLPLSRVQTTPTPTLQKKKKEAKVQVEIRNKMLMEKYFQKWRFKAKLWNCKLSDVQLPEGSWMKKALFLSTSANIRATQCAILEEYCKVPGRKQAIVDVLTSCLGEVGSNGEASNEFLALYKKMMQGNHWRFYLALKGTLIRISQLIKEEIEKLQRLEVLSLSSDLSQGFALNALTNLMADFLEVDSIKHHYKNRLVGSVLDGYLSLKKLVVQRTKLIDETQEKLLKLLEEMTTGTELEAREFMVVCVETVDKYPMNDHISPVFIFERLCNIIYPKNNDTKDFQMSLEKDPQQEDFLQGRMLGNPYNSTEAGLGPLMRDVKNKICQDCDLVALLEDDTGMELLVSNKIISLDLSVKDVHKRIWLADHSETEPMKVVYRMRGLLGDATEDMVNSLDTGKDSDVDCEEVYRMASVMGECNGLKVMLDRLAMIRNLVTGKPLMEVLLKLFTYCLKIKSNKRQLMQKELQSITKMLGALNLALLAEQENSVSTQGQTLTEQILQIMEVILLEASSHLPPDVYREFSQSCGDKDQLMMLLDRINSPFVRSNPSVLQALMRLIPFLAYGDDHKMMALINHFKPYLQFERFDMEHTDDEQVHLDCFCSIAQGIENNANGRRLKDLMASESTFVHECMAHILRYSPSTSGSSVFIENKALKELITKASLPFILRILTGLCSGHDPTKVKLAEIIPTLHTLEQISSDERVGSLAENLLEAMKEHPEVAKKIEDFRKQTKAEKKRMAMAMRQKQLNQLGMMTNEKGQLKVTKDLVGGSMESLKDEVGLVCCICREGYKNQPNKVLSIYTFSKRVNLDDFENRSRRTIGYSSVTHFNIVHYDCHLAAVRHARARDEWESAALQNGNTKCNGLLPLWGPEVLESSYASCLARHNGYLQENTGIRDTTHLHTIHDLKHLLLKFAMEKSFSEDTGGGGKSSNIHLIPYLMHTALYVINMTRSEQREEKNLQTFLKCPPEKLIESCYETEGALYWSVMACHLLGAEGWKKYRVSLLKRLFILAHARNLSASYVPNLSDKNLKEYRVYKPYLVFYALVHTIYQRLFKSVVGEENWSVSLADYIRNNDQALTENCKSLLSDLEDSILPCASFDEFCDIIELLDEVMDAKTWFQEILDSLP